MSTRRLFPRRSAIAAAAAAAAMPRRRRIVRHLRLRAARRQFLRLDRHLREHETRSQQQAGM